MNDILLVVVVETLWIDICFEENDFNQRDLDVWWNLFERIFLYILFDADVSRGDENSGAWLVKWSSLTRTACLYKTLEHS